MKKEKQWKFLLVAVLFAIAAYNYRGLEKVIGNITWYQNYMNFSANEAMNSEDYIKPYINENRASIRLYALSACLMDANSLRVLYEKDAFSKMPMASTTKIMTLIVVLENANLEDIVTVSTNAAKQPDVQLNINTGEQYVLKDLLYSLMLESHNDVAVAIAEHVGGSVETFCNMMTAKAHSIGAKDTQFKTPNGLDADGHYTTAADLALIGSYAIKNEEFRNIVGTSTYSIKEITKGRTFTVTNKDRFLYMMEGAIGIKTGFTGKAGYCFVGAVDVDGKTLVSVVLGSGWPPNKSYKWADTQKLMKFGIENYSLHRISDYLYKQQPDFRIPSKISIAKGQKTEVLVYTKKDIMDEEVLLREGEIVQARINMKGYIVAPIEENTVIGTVEYYINDKLFHESPIYVKEDVKEINFPFVLKELFQIYF